MSKAKKSFGQHFLINESLAESIVQYALDAAKTLPILEIGPGKGSLTKYLIVSKHPFKAIEADKDMVAFFSEEYPDHFDQIIPGNVLKVPLDQCFDGKEFLLLGNFPYNISSQIIFHAIKHRTHIPHLIGMFQKEVADRIIAPHGSKTYGAISVLAQVHYQGKTIFKVAPGSFSPPPKVNSSVILLHRNNRLPEEINYSLFKSVVKNSFGQRRKMLRNSLKSLVKDPSMMEEKIFTFRPEQISVDGFIDLALQIQNQNI